MYNLKNPHKGRLKKKKTTKNKTTHSLMCFQVRFCGQMCLDLELKIPACGCREQCFSSPGPRDGRRVSPGNSETQTLRPHPIPAEAEILRAGLRRMCFQQPSRRFGCMLEFRHHGSGRNDGQDASYLSLLLREGKVALQPSTVHTCVSLACMFLWCIFTPHAFLKVFLQMSHWKRVSSFCLPNAC